MKYPFKSDNVRTALLVARSFLLLVSVLSCLLLLLNQPVRSAESDPLPAYSALIAPAAPGFTLLGIEPAAVERPGNVSDFAVFLLNRTENSEALLQDWAVEFAPYWIFAGQNLRYEDYRKNTLSANLLQSLALSAAVSSGDSTSADLGLGLRFALLRGEIDPSSTSSMDNLLQAVKSLSANFDNAWRDSCSKDSAIQALLTLPANVSQAELDSLAKQINDRQDDIKQQIIQYQEVQIAEIEKISEKIVIRRIGWKVDAAGGAACTFLEREFDKGRINRWGFWLTGGKEWQQNSAFGVLRIMGEPDYDGTLSLDAGGRVYMHTKRKTSISLEAVYRWLPNLESTEENNLEKNDWRLALILDYSLGVNKSMSFTFGRDMENQKAGNLIALLHIALGFGREKLDFNLDEYSIP
ncbi:MAG: hypothetical protein ABH878_03250 [bacterium]